MLAVEVVQPVGCIRALRAKGGKRAYSLAAAYLQELVRAEQVRLDQQAAAAEVKAQTQALTEPQPTQHPVPASAGPRPAFVRPTLLSELMEL